MACFSQFYCLHSEVVYPRKTARIASVSPDCLPQLNPKPSAFKQYYIILSNLPSLNIKIGNHLISTTREKDITKISS